jgi:hypothetical protein
MALVVRVHHLQGSSLKRKWASRESRSIRKHRTALGYRCSKRSANRLAAARALTLLRYTFCGINDLARKAARLTLSRSIRLTLSVTLRIL